jgi:hypothetical protein
VAVPRSSSAIPAATYTYLEQIGFFTGVGVLIIVCAAVAMGRFSMLSANDAVPADDYDDYSDQVGVTQPSGPFSPGPRPYAGEEPTQTQEPVPPFGTSDYPATSSSPFPPAEPPSSTFPRSNSQFG